MVRSKLLTVAAATLLSQLVQARYRLDTLYDSSNFFDEFNHINYPDPTHGFVEYVDRQTGQTDGLSGIKNGTIYMGVDHTTANPPSGRRSVRLESQKTFTQGLFIADIAHMPTNACGVWPAFWTYGDDWPNSGEIDILEGVNTQTSNQVSLHTSQGCEMSSFGASRGCTVVSKDCGSQSGCSQTTSDNQNYGDGFNAIGGGVYAMEWTDYRIAVWFFPRSDIPSDIAAGEPHPILWDKPMASFSAGLTCDIPKKFTNNRIVFDTTFCGDWAGSVWQNNGECQALGSCKDYVASNPEAFAQAYWSVNSVKVYKSSLL
ncbi:hypothetical protein NLG97_g2225 [Lecanicillium saksenae]|uniref:Uncharacterized protein n=1 Tax=Lecanicillium saksenae TaxID=468837 RepID=A0ACC1R399_9HYPO|nr:hypothetical protein NLG97_g2225 [Lecanicillium saksenae]